MGDDDALSRLRHNLIGRGRRVFDLHRRQHDLDARWAEWKADREQAQAAGRDVPSLFNDQTHQALVSDLETMLGELRGLFGEPHLEPQAAAELRQRLSPEQKATLRAELMQQIQAAAPDVQASVASGLEDALRQLAAEHGPSSDFQEVVDKLEASKRRPHGDGEVPRQDDGEEV